MKSGESSWNSKVLDRLRFKVRFWNVGLLQAQNPKPETLNPKVSRVEGEGCKVQGFRIQVQGLGYRAQDVVSGLDSLDVGFGRQRLQRKQHQM